MPYTIRPKPSRSRYMMLGKRVLLGLAVVMGVSIVFISNYQGGEKGGRVVLSGAEKKAKTAAVMENPNYYGVDSQNRPFTISAKQAVQTDKDTIDLKQLQADMLLEESNWLSVSADDGQITQQGTQIILRNHVQMFYEGGYEFGSNYAKILPDHGIASGNQPIQGQGPTSTLLADSFEVKNHGEIIIFRNNVKTTLYLD